MEIRKCTTNLLVSVKLLDIDHVMSKDMLDNFQSVIVLLQFKYSAKNRP